ncbi:MAG: hypothetical protein ACSLE6_19210 [Mycobacterium sp.]
MKQSTLLLSCIAGGAGAAAGLLIVAAPAMAASSAQNTINLLEAQGFTVRIDRIGSAPLDQCVVTDIGNPTESQGFIDNDDDDNNPFEDVRRTVTVSLDCTR